MQRGVVQSPSEDAADLEIPPVPNHAPPPEGSASAEFARRLGLTSAAAQRLDAAAIKGQQSPVIAASLLGLAPEHQIASAVADMAQTPMWKETAPDPPLSAPQLNSQFLQDVFAVPLAERLGRLCVGLVDPTNVQAREGLIFALAGQVDFYTIPFSMWRQASPVSVDDASRSGGEVQGRAIHQWADDVERLRDFQRDAPVVRHVDRLFEKAVLAAASDIHVEQKADHALVRLRVDGSLRDLEHLPADLAPALIARVKVLADLDVASRRAPQDGRTTVSVRGEPIDVRISTTPTAFGESLVVRLLHRRAVSFELTDLGFSERVERRIKDMLQSPHGLILVTGPTGSGKTTTLYAALRQLADGARKILTIEDPIEYLFEDINQTQLNEAAGVTFASALRAFLRHDPDVILVGEIRDTETARLAVQAALTGHLVLATLHTNDAPAAPSRLIDMGVERYLLGGVLRGVVAQRLAPKVCPQCCGKNPTLQECPTCEGSGRAGRSAIGEAFLMDDDLERLIVEGAPTGQLRRFLIEEKGFQTLRQDGLEKADQGIIAAEDVVRITFG